MLPTINEFVSKYGLENFVVVADSGLMNNTNIAELEAHGYKYKHGALTKGNINKRGYNKFLSMDGEVKVAINYDRVADDSKWDGLKGYLTNTDIHYI